MKVMRINKRKSSKITQESGKETVSEASSPESSYEDSINTDMISNLDVSSMSGATTVSSNGSDKVPHEKKLKFAATKEVYQFQVAPGSLNKKVTNSAKKM